MFRGADLADFVDEREARERFSEDVFRGDFALVRRAKDHVDLVGVDLAAGKREVFSLGSEKVDRSDCTGRKFFIFVRGDRDAVKRPLQKSTQPPLKVEGLDLGVAEKFGGRGVISHLEALCAVELFEPVGGVKS